jgi:hypothetical protein
MALKIAYAYVHQTLLVFKDEDADRIWWNG